ncbi:MAG: MepB family protein [Dermatophilaceae bacterium]
MPSGPTGFSAFEWYAEHVLMPQQVPTSVIPEEQNGDYESGLAIIAGERWRIRTAKVTPTKPGAFVAVWRRAADRGTEPFPVDDPTSGLIVFVEDGAHRRGLFRFTAEHLRDLGVTRSEAQPGKRGFRLYPRWCSGLNRHAASTQAAQAPAFTRLPPP